MKKEKERERKREKKKKKKKKKKKEKEKEKERKKKRKKNKVANFFADCTFADVSAQCPLPVSLFVTKKGAIKASTTTLPSLILSPHPPFRTLSQCTSPSSSFLLIFLPCSVVPPL